MPEPIEHEEDVNLEQFNQVPEPEGQVAQPAPAADNANKDAQPQTPAEPKPAAAAEPAKAAEEDAYALLDTLGDDKIKVDSETLKSFKEIAKANNLTPDAAKSIVELQLGLAKKQQEEFDKVQKSWEDASKVVYGDNLKNIETNCSRVLAELDKYGKFKELLGLVGAEKHPATLGFLKAVGDKMLEKPAVNPSATVSGEDREPELEDFN